jgi:hypothetical protein
VTYLEAGTEHASFSKIALIGLNGRVDMDWNSRRVLLHEELKPQIAAKKDKQHRIREPRNSGLGVREQDRANPKRSDEKTRTGILLFYHFAIGKDFLNPAPRRLGSDHVMLEDARTKRKRESWRILLDAFRNKFTSGREVCRLKVVSSCELPVTVGRKEGK